MPKNAGERVKEIADRARAEARKNIEEVAKDEPNTEYKLIKNKEEKTPTTHTKQYIILIKDTIYKNTESEITLRKHKDPEKKDQLKIHLKTRRWNNQTDHKIKKLTTNITQGLNEIPQTAINLERETGHDLPYTKILQEIYNDFQETQENEELWKPQEKQDLPYFTDKGKFVSLWLGEDIMNDYHFATHEDSNQLYVYQDGIYKDNGEKKAKQEAQKRLGQYRRNHYINETLEMIKIENYTPPNKFNNPNGSIVVENGLLDLETRELKPHSPKHIHITKIPWEYNPEADCPEIKQFISEVVHDCDIKLIQEMFGYCLLRDYPYAKAFMLRGEGANGKSTLLELLEKFLGEDNVATPSLQELLNNKFAKIDLHGKLANIHADLSAEKLDKTGTFKMLTGGDTIRGEKKYQGAINFKNHAKLIYSSNQLPRTTDRTNAFFRRWITIDFPNTFTSKDSKTKTDLPNCLINEESMSGLLNWALDGLDRIKEQNGFSMTDARKKIKEEWIMNSDSVRGFINKAITTEQEAIIKKKDLYKVYQAFCNENNLHVAQPQTLTKKLNTMIPQAQQIRPRIDGDRPRCWKNICLRKDFELQDSLVQDVPRLYTTTIACEGSNNDNGNYKKGNQNTQDILDQGVNKEKEDNNSIDSNKTIDNDLDDDDEDLEIEEIDVE